LPCDLCEQPIKIAEVRHVSLDAGDIYSDLPHRRGQLLCTPARDEHIRAFVHRWCYPSNAKPAHNSGSNAPPPFIDDLFDVSDRSVMPMVVQKKHLIEPHTGDDKGARARQAFRGAGFEGTGLDDALEEQLDGFAPIGIEVTFPRVRIRRQLLGG